MIRKRGRPYHCSHLRRVLSARNLITPPTPSFSLGEPGRESEREREGAREREGISAPRPTHIIINVIPLICPFSTLLSWLCKWWDRELFVHPLGAETRNRRLELELTFERMFAIINWMSPSSSCSSRSCESAQEFPHHEPTNYFPRPDPCPAHRLSTNRSFLTNNIQIWNIVIDIEFLDDSFQS